MPHISRVYLSHWESTKKTTWRASNPVAVRFSVCHRNDILPLGNSKTLSNKDVPSEVYVCLYIALIVNDMNGVTQIFLHHIFSKYLYATRWKNNQLSRNVWMCLADSLEIQLFYKKPKFFTKRRTTKIWCCKKGSKSFRKKTDFIKKLATDIFMYIYIDVLKMYKMLYYIKNSFFCVKVKLILIFSGIISFPNIASEKRNWFPRFNKNYYAF